MDELFANVTWYSAGWVVVSGLFSLLGSTLALRMLPTGLAITSPAGSHIPSLGRCTLLLTLSGWASFLACFEAFYPHLDPQFPLFALLQGWLIQGGAAALAALIVARGARNIRNVALAGALLSGGASCMLFVSMSVLAAPAPLGYNLLYVLAVMAVSGTFAAIGFWHAGAPDAGQYRLAAAALIAASLVLVAGGSLFSILSFSEWSEQIVAPHGFAFRPIIAVFLCETAVVAMLGVIGAAIDRRAASLIDRENERLRELADSTFEALVIHRDGIVLDANRVFCSLVGKPLAAIRGERFAAFLCDVPDDNARLPGSPPVADRNLIAADGQQLPVEVLSRDIAFAGGRAEVTALRDIRERQAAEEKIRFLAHHDVLTGLPNRAQLHDIIAWHPAQAVSAGDPVAVLCLDLDRFKAVNDTFGHQAGDRLLQLVAERILGNIRTGDAAARIGGDEFILLMTGISRPDSIAQLARRLIDALSLPFWLGGYEARIGASIGIAVGPQDGTTAEALIKNADIALYRAKANGRGGFCFFESGMDRLQLERRAMEHDLRQAVAEEAFELVFQPQFACATNEVVSFEALMRWSHGTRGAVSPVEFIPLAEATGLIVSLGKWALRTACQAAMSWPKPCIVAVNVSPRQFVSEDFADIVEAALDETGLDPRRLELEITESVMMHEADRALHSLKRLRALGIHVALDDFGTGFSSLSYLQRFPFDKVKIDKSFIRDLTEYDSARAIVAAILAMSHQLGLTVTAEGVETDVQLAMLRQQDCDLIQGFLLSRPIPMDLVPGFLTTRQQIEASRAVAALV